MRNTIINCGGEVHFQTKMTRFILEGDRVIGVEAVNLVPASSRGAAVGAYSLFIDLSLGITGPLVGAVAAGFGFASIFLFAALAALSGLLLSVYLYRQAQRARVT